MFRISLGSLALILIQTLSREAHFLPTNSWAIILKWVGLLEEHLLGLQPLLMHRLFQGGAVESPGPSKAVWADQRCLGNFKIGNLWPLCSKWACRFHLWN